MCGLNTDLLSVLTHYDYGQGYIYIYADRLCGLVVRVPGYRSRKSWVRFLALPDFLSSSGSGTESTQPH
jgi:hypothetical protein